MADEVDGNSQNCTGEVYNQYVIDKAIMALCGRTFQ